MRRDARKREEADESEHSRALIKTLEGLEASEAAARAMAIASDDDAAVELSVPLTLVDAHTR